MTDSSSMHRSGWDGHPLPALERTLLPEMQKLLANVVRKRPALESRAQLAGLIRRYGSSPIAPKRFTVQGSEEDPYAVDILRRTCSCKDFQYRAPEYSAIASANTCWPRSSTKP